MSAQNYVRLRQICLAASDIAHTERVFSDVLGLDVCHRSRLPQFGLENIMYAINGSFLEIVAPIQPETAVDRFLARNNGRGGYMAIFDCADVDHHKSLAAAEGVAPIFERRNEKGDLLQLNPKQTGATMMEIDHHNGGDNMMDNYHWAGEGWQKYVSTDVTGEILGIEICSPGAKTRAKLWGRICDRPVQPAPEGFKIELDYGVIHFKETPDRAEELFTAIDLTAKNPEEMREKAKTAGCNVTSEGFDFCGVTFRLSPAA